MKKSQAGFTLIELIVVIVILGILAAFALPRFADLDKEARKAVTEGLGGSIRASSSLAHGKLLATNATTNISMEGASVDMVFKYPSTADIANTIIDISGFTSYSIGGKTRFIADGVTNANSTSCMIEYQEPSAANEPPSITVSTTDCS